MNGQERPDRRRAPAVSVVCAVTRHSSDLQEVHREFARVLERTGKSFEFLYVLDGPLPAAEQALAQIEDGERPVRVFRLARGFGEATALEIGFEQAGGRHVLTIPDRPQIDPQAAQRVLAELERGWSVVVTRRDPRRDSWFNRLQSRVFHGLVGRIVGQRFRDMTCGVRGFTAEAARRLDLYGVQHRFIPVVAVRNGFRVLELPAEQHPDDRRLRLWSPAVYARRLLEILNIYFLTRFTRKPLRFFGSIGGTLGMVGFVICAYLAWLKLIGATGLSDRPLLLLGVLLIVLGVQVVSIGLLGEIILFLSSKRETPHVAELRPERRDDLAS